MKASVGRSENEDKEEWARERHKNVQREEGIRRRRKKEVAIERK